MWFTGDFYITRFVFQRALALVYLIGFAIVLMQFRPLLGEKGLLPVPQFVKLVRFWDSPSIFFFLPKDWAFMGFGVFGFLLSLFALSSFSERFGLIVSMLTWFFLWAIYLSFVNVGQEFYAFGWESMLLEVGFLAIFLGDMGTKVPLAIILLLRFVLFKNMFGAGLIKLRGDSCWRDLTCLNYHYQTQPIPNPLSWYFHYQPEWFHKFGVLFNHFIEVIVPFSFFLTAPIAAIGGLLTMFFQGMIMLSGNFAFLNFLTLVMCIPTFSDEFLAKILPMSVPASLAPSPTFIVVVAIILATLNLQPLLNMISPRQVMNASFDPLHIVGTYGAFGTITKDRYEVIIEGTSDTVLTSSTVWKEYEFFGKPGRLNAMPPQIAPYHLRLDWLMWFAAFSPRAQDPWFVHLMEKLLQGDTATLSLLKTNPFPDKPPIFVRAKYYKYEYTTPQEKQQTGNWWKREYVGEYFPIVSTNSAQLKLVLEQFGWN